MRTTNFESPKRSWVRALPAKVEPGGRRLATESEQLRSSEPHRVLRADRMAAVASLAASLGHGQVEPVIFRFRLGQFCEPSAEVDPTEHVRRRQEGSFADIAHLSD